MLLCSKNPHRRVPKEVWTKLHLVTFRCDERRCPGHKNVCRWFLNRSKQLLGPSKLGNCVFLEK